MLNGKPTIGFTAIYLFFFALLQVLPTIVYNHYYDFFGLAFSEGNAFYSKAIVFFHVVADVCAILAIAIGEGGVLNIGKLHIEDNAFKWAAFVFFVIAVAIYAGTFSDYAFNESTIPKQFIR